jgi:ubiquinone biosynthesis protein
MEVTSGLKLRHASRYAALARLLLEHRNAPLERAYGVGADPEEGEAGGTKDSADADALVAELVSLGPTFIKLGQLLSTRADLLPPLYLDALARLRDDVEPLAEGEAEKIVAEELGVRISTAFGSFETKPIGSASLGQVHRATLREGRTVAVKVQRPGIRRQVIDDMEVIAELAEFLDNHSEVAGQMGFVSMVEEFRRSLMDELDYRREAANLRLLGEHLEGYSLIVVPQPVKDYSTSRVLTMDYIEGRSIDSLGPLEQLELDGKALADELVSAYLDQVLVHGFFHADPHPGNVLLAADGRLALVDLGMVARLSPQTQEQLLRLLLAISSNDGSAAADALDRLGERLEGFDSDGMRGDVSETLVRHGGATIGQLATGRLLAELAVASSANGVRPRPALTLLAKALLNLDQVARILDPEISVDKIIEGHASRMMRHRMMDAASPAKVMKSALDAAAFAEELPARLNKVLESLAEGKLTLNLEGLDEGALMRGAQKLANRVATGVVVAAFVVAAALFSGDRTGPTLWGYPVLTLVFLGLAGAVSICLVVSILRRDLPQRARRR